MKAALGAGECAGGWSEKRMQYKQCNMKRCVLDKGSPTISCNKTMDIVLLIDGSGSLGKRGWAAEITAAQLLVDAFIDPLGAASRAKIAVILYSGPRTWGGVRRCTAKNTKKVDRAEICAVKMITHFTSDMKKVKELIGGLEWPRGSTLTSLALMTAKAELSLGRGKAKSNVVLFTDGRPLSYRKTYIASTKVRQAARLVWVPVTKYAPLKFVKRCATRRWQENVVPVTSFAALKKPEVVTHIIADICPKSNPKVKMGRVLG